MKLTVPEQHQAKIARDTLRMSDVIRGGTEMTDKPKYSIHGYRSDNTDGGYDDESTAETLKEAKDRAKYMMSEEHTRTVEATVPVVYVTVQRYNSDDILLELFGRRGQTS